MLPAPLTVTRQTHISSVHTKTNLNDKEHKAFYGVVLLYGGVPGGDHLIETETGISVGGFKLVLLHAEVCCLRLFLFKNLIIINVG